VALDVAAEERAAGRADDRARRAMGHRRSDQRAGATADEQARRAVAAVAAVAIMCTLR